MAEASSASLGLKFPEHPNREWYAVDLLQNHERVAVSVDTLREGLKRALSDRRLPEHELLEAAATYGTKKIRSLVKAAVESRAP